MSSHPTALRRQQARLAAPERGGFTLVELLVALVLTATVVAVLFELLVGQGRIVRLQNAREEVQQNARATLELIASELRGVDSRAITAAGSNTITFRMPRAWGVVCEHTPDRLAALFPSAAVHALRTGDEFLAIPPAGLSTSWQYLAVTDRTTNSAEWSAAAARCAALQPSIVFTSGGRSPVRSYVGRETASSPATLGLPAGGEGLPPGTPIYVYDDVRYGIGTSAGTPGSWIRRNTGPALQMHPLAGPVPPTHGLVFRYLDAEGLPVTDLGTAAGRERIARVEITVVAHSRALFNNQPQQDSVSTLVYLRNR
jgi:prepilin-type N-terminal cleavage/methylation domain-containing protein